MADVKKESEVIANDIFKEEKEEKWAKYYSSHHEILLVGDGDFSFSLSLALTFGSASNIVTSSLDSYELVIKKYKNAKSNLERLKELGANILHGVDATKMKLHTDLRMRKFDRIVYNFPHAGFHGKEDQPHIIRKHRNLVHGFFSNACGMLRANGEIHVTHKTTVPFSHWGIEELASQNSLLLIACVDFNKQDFLGYEQKRGDGGRSDEPFPLGECCTFKFRFSHKAKKKTKRNKTLTFHPVQRIPVRVKHNLRSFECPHHVDNLSPVENLSPVFDDYSPRSVWSPLNNGIRSQYRLREYCNFESRFSPMATFKRTLDPPYRIPRQFPESPLENMSSLLTYSVRSQYESFHLREYCNFESRFSPMAENMTTFKRTLDPLCTIPQQHPETSLESLSSFVNYNPRPWSRFRLSDGYLDHATTTFSDNEYDEYSFSYERRPGFDRHIGEEPRRFFNDHYNLYRASARSSVYPDVAGVEFDHYL